MIARRNIVTPGSYSHVFFRCHDRQYFLKDTAVKIFLLFLWCRYKVKYGIKIFDFAIMDNHAHIFLQAKDAECLGQFMRTVNSQLARFINFFYKRDSQAIRERYKSPLITNNVYMVNVVQYIWLNRYKVDGADPRFDPFISLSWRMHFDLIKGVFAKEKGAELLNTLLDSYDELPVEIDGSFRGLTHMVNEAIQNIKSFAAGIYEHSHTIGDATAVAFRSELLSAFRQPRYPWTMQPTG